MNQHKDLLYLQKYATYQFNNRTFSTQNTKISACSLAISYICFQVGIVKKRKGEGKPYYQLLRKIWWLPHPPTPNKGSIREIATGEITLPITPDDHLEGPYFLKTRELPGAPPPGPPAGTLRRAPGPHPYEARGGLRARIFPPTPFFCKSPPESPQRCRSWGCWGSSRPPPPMKILGGGANLSFCPPPQ